VEETATKPAPSDGHEPVRRSMIGKNRPWRATVLCRIAPVLAALLASPLMAGTFSSPRLIPEGTVTLAHSGAVLDREVPVPDGMLMRGNGRCLIEGDGMQIITADKTVFALRDEIGRSCVTILQGAIEFTLRPDAKPAEWALPFDTVQARPAPSPGGSAGVVRGTLDVTPDNAVLTVTHGGLEISKAGERKLVPSGDGITLNRLTFDESTVHPQDESTEIESGPIGMKFAAGFAAVSGLTAGALALSAGSDGSGGSNSADATSPE